CCLLSSEPPKRKKAPTPSPIRSKKPTLHIRMRGSLDAGSFFFLLPAGKSSSSSSSKSSRRAAPLGRAVSSSSSRLGRRLPSTFENVPLDIFDGRTGITAAHFGQWIFFPDLSSATFRVASHSGHLIARGMADPVEKIQE